MYAIEETDKTEENTLMRKLLASLTVTAFALTGCMTGDKFAQMHPNMAKSEVIGLLVNPKGYQFDGTNEILQYPGGRISGWSYDTADFYVTLHDGMVLNYGATNVQKGQTPSTVFLFPMKFR
jgi:hypothetical protein